MSTTVVRRDDIGLRCQGGGYRVRPIPPKESGEAADMVITPIRQLIEANYTSRLKRPVSIRIDGTSAYEPGDRVTATHYGGTQLVRIDGDKRTEIWFTADDQPDWMYQ